MKTKLNKAIRAALAAALLCIATTPLSARAQEEALLPNSVDLPLVQGSTIPEECYLPEDLVDDARYEAACVTMPRMGGSRIGAAYIGLLGERGWTEGPYLDRGFSAVRPVADAGVDCNQRLNIFPSDYPPEEHGSPEVVIWFVLERQPRCGDARLAP